MCFIVVLNYVFRSHSVGFFCSIVFVLRASLLQYIVSVFCPEQVRLTRDSQEFDLLMSKFCPRKQFFVNIKVLLRSTCI